MVRLDAVFKRYPKLTNKQRKELARRRFERALQSIPFEVSTRLNLWWAIGYCGIPATVRQRQHGRG